MWSQSYLRPRARQTWAGLALILLVGLGLRFFQLDRLPPGLFGDEALVTLHAREAVASQDYPIYFSQSDGGFHPAVVYLTMLARALTGSHPYAVRFGVAAASLLSLALVFAALRAVFQLDFDSQPADALALVGTFILAITFPFVLISRVGFEVSLPIPAGAAVFWALALRGRRTGSGPRAVHLLLRPLAAGGGGHGRGLGDTGGRPVPMARPDAPAAQRL